MEREQTFEKNGNVFHITLKEIMTRQELLDRKRHYNIIAGQIEAELAKVKNADKEQLMKDFEKQVQAKLDDLPYIEEQLADTKETISKIDEILGETIEETSKETPENTTEN